MAPCHLFGLAQLAAVQVNTDGEDGEDGDDGDAEGEVGERNGDINERDQV